MKINNLPMQMMLLDSYAGVARSHMMTAERLATGLKINSASHDASIIGVVSQVDAKLKEQRAISQTAIEATAFLSTQDEALNSMGGILSQMIAIKKEADAATALGEDTSALEDEYKTLQSEFLGLTMEQFNGSRLFASGATNEVEDYFLLDGGRAFQITKYTPQSLMLGDSFRVGETESTYSKVTASLNWNAAKADAEARGGHLAVITSLEEYNKVQADAVGGWGGWLGIEKPIGGSWISITGEPLPYTNWLNGWNGHPTQENVAIIRFDGINGLWQKGSVAASYILEVETPITLSDVSIDDLESNLQNLALAIAQNGSEQNRVARVQSITNANIQNLNGIASRWEEADIPAESIRNATQGILMESSLALLAQANTRSQSILHLLYARVDKVWESPSQDKEKNSDRYVGLRQSLIGDDEEESVRT
jgi:flagellin